MLRLRSLDELMIFGIGSRVEDCLDNFELAAEFTDKCKWLAPIPTLSIFDVQVTANSMLLQSICVYIQQGEFTTMYFL